jgi:hypothetical protein
MSHAALPPGSGSGSGSGCESAAAALATSMATSENRFVLKLSPTTPATPVAAYDTDSDGGDTKAKPAATASFAVSNDKKTSKKAPENDDDEEDSEDEDDDDEDEDDDDDDEDEDEDDNNNNKDSDAEDRSSVAASTLAAAAAAASTATNPQSTHTTTTKIKARFTRPEEVRLAHFFNNWQSRENKPLSHAWHQDASAPVQELKELARSMNRTVSQIESKVRGNTRHNSFFIGCSSSAEQQANI